MPADGDAPQGEGNHPITKYGLQNMLEGLLEKANENAMRMLDEKIPEQKSEKHRKLEKVKAYTESRSTTI